ncbi:MAG TPA: Crp/Fnr family transcriptional regulator [Bacteroidales bacterium]|nr:Crp/Fnr family transcriptional regulator [Bacteroidales bacterium]
MTIDTDRLARSPLFRGLTGRDFEALLNVTVYRTRNFRAGTMIAQSGEPVSSLIIVTEGKVKGEMVDYDGRIIKIEDIPAPGALAPAFMFGRRNIYPVNVIALTDSVLFYIERKDLLDLFMKSERVLINFLDMVANRSQFLSDKIRFLSFKTIRSKLAHYLLGLSEKHGNTFRLDLTQEGLAEFFGVTRPSVARELGRIEAEGYISASGKNIVILDRNGLSECVSV